MSYQFEGQLFESLEAWRRAFPAYRSYSEFVKAGADTIQKIEAAIAERARNHRKKSIAGSIKGRIAYPYIVPHRKRKPCQ